MSVSNKIPIHRSVLPMLLMAGFMATISTHCASLAKQETPGAAPVHLTQIAPQVILPQSLLILKGQNLIPSARHTLHLKGSIKVVSGSVREVIHQAEIHTAHFMILGGPGESEESIKETILTSDRIEKTIFFPFFGMRIYPNTKVFDIAVAEGRIKLEEPILEPVYYLANDINYKSIKAKSKKANNRWIFPDDNTSFQKPMEMMRKKGIKGPLWELLIKQ